MSKIASLIDVIIANDGLLKVDGITTFRRVVRDGIIYIQFYDRDKMRSQCRGTREIEVPLVLLVEILTTNSESKQNEPIPTTTK